MPLYGHQERCGEHDSPKDDGSARPIRPFRFAMEVQLAEHCIPLICKMFLICSKDRLFT
jgi:hypothetical protein